MAGELTGSATGVLTSFLTVIIYFILGLGLLGITALVFNIAKYNIKVTIYEKVGNQIKERKTKAGIVKNRKRNKREELHVRKDIIKFWKTWTLPLEKLNENLWPSKGKSKQIYLYKVGEHDQDLHYLQPPKFEEQEVIRPIDSSKLEWFADGIAQDQVFYAQKKGNFEKFFPYFGLGIIAVVAIFGFIYGVEAYKDFGAKTQSMVSTLESVQKLQTQEAQAKAGITPIPQVVNQPVTQSQPDQTGIRGLLNEGGVT